ncbi:hypothetical protein [Streptomyces himalayensis]|uniref:hypothetical protein n=1 Tax=Streptomyces himalayensis TaxID=2820085 RepID=UPI001FE24C1D|nr:hypothetical protein [Streptomyces himalayensis]
MADPQSNAHLRAGAGAPTSGVIHVRTRLTAEFTVIANALAQRTGSAVTVGVATYILSLPDGAPVSIAALCDHFTEGEILISRALRELEQAGYLERRRERGPGGRIRTRTYFYDLPSRGLPTSPPPRQPQHRQRTAADEALEVPTQSSGPESASDSGTASGTPSTPETPTAPTNATPLATSSSSRPSSPTVADEQAVAILASLRIVDPRLILSVREVDQLAPAITQWLAAGVGPAQITDALTTGLPDRLRARPARILAFRLSESPLAPPAPVITSPTALPWQTCDGCERAFRAAEAARCRDCALGSSMGTADRPALIRSTRLPAAC